ncbi:asialoglycoprotein receptor 1 [Zootoca vivipara]|uniref:asialoglycoprotein receptor 1 n=1 Tax=Zootoca vivipara TaxID=8524 RepID=UPI00293BC9C8|nr:asialoglycoprotein receptor 1 [Zootoca vivipara]XP_060137919.1 asialoglycoprotein receptor 1 [Zootoca vivipara]XP_060137920.1 asialoglycoprotein receptor 1 [Zootoca vivipara]
MEDKEEDLSSGGFGLRPSDSWGQRVCPGHRLVFVLLGLVCIFTIAVAVFGLTGRKSVDELRGMEETLKGVNRTVSAELADLKKKEAEDLKQLVKIEHMLQNLTEEAKEVKTHFQEQISKLRTSMRTHNCEVESIKSNKTVGSHCCLKGWLPFKSSCYWLSKTDKSWDEAKLDCEDKDAHLVIITSYLEQQFVAQLTKPRNTWIGLSMASGVWKWVDGTAYTIRRIDWRPGEPDNFSIQMPYHPAHCAHLYRDGLWSDESCSRRYNWVCEMNG